MKWSWRDRTWEVTATYRGWSWVDAYCLVVCLIATLYVAMKLLLWAVG